MGKISPFAPKRLPHLPAVDGVRLAAGAAGVRYPGRIDLLLALFDPGTTVAGVLTKSKTASAPVDWCRERFAHGMARALVVNSGNANAFTGKRGRAAAQHVIGEAGEGVVEVARVDVAQGGDPELGGGLLAGRAALAVLAVVEAVLGAGVGDQQDEPGCRAVT